MPRKEKIYQIRYRHGTFYTNAYSFEDAYKTSTGILGARFNGLYDWQYIGQEENFKDQTDLFRQNEGHRIVINEAWVAPRAWSFACHFNRPWKWTGTAFISDADLDYFGKWCMPHGGYIKRK